MLDRLPFACKTGILNTVFIDCKQAEHAAASAAHCFMIETKKGNIQMMQRLSTRVRGLNQAKKVVLLVALVRLITAQFITPYNILADSASYVRFPFENLLALQLNGRTPVYPIIIRLCYLAFGEVYFYQAVVLLQSIASLVSVLFFYKMLCLVLKHKNVCFWVAVLYGACPSIYGWDSCILTESFALSGAVVFLYYMVSYIQKARFADGAISIALMLVLTFLRPTFLVFDALLLAFWVGRWMFCKEERKLALKLCLCSGAAFAVIITYACIFYQSFGYYSISDPMPRQSLIINIERGYYAQSTNEAYKAAVLAGLEANYWDPWTTAADVLEVFSEPEIIAITDEYIKTYPLQYAADTFIVFGSLAEEKFKNYYEYNVSSWANPLLPIYQTYEIVFAPLRIGHLYVLMFAELIVAIALWVKGKRPPWLHLGLAAFLFCVVCSSIVATCDEYPRTMLCALPFAYLSCAIFVNWLCEGVIRTAMQGVQPTATTAAAMADAQCINDPTESV